MGFPAGCLHDAEMAVKRTQRSYDHRLLPTSEAIMDTSRPAARYPRREAFKSRYTKDRLRTD